MLTRPGGSASGLMTRTLVASSAREHRPSARTFRLLPEFDACEVGVLLWRRALRRNRDSASVTRGGFWRRWLPVAGLTLLGLGLRLPGLHEKSYWTDEVDTVDLVRGGLGNAWSELVHTQNTPPLYYVLAWPWAHVFGTSEIGLRSLSTLLSVALIPIAYLIGAQLLSSRVGLVAAALAATNPMLVWYGQEAKAYALLSLLTAISFLLFLRALDTPTTGRLVAWGVCCGLAVATHYFAVFLVAVEAAVLLWKARPRARVLAAAAIPVVTALALLPLTASQGSPDWVNEMSLAGRVIKTPAVFII